MIKLVVVGLFLPAIFFQPAAAFWRPCNATIRAPDRVVSPNCSGNSCRVQRGGLMRASVFATSPLAHRELRIQSVAFIMGVPVRMPVNPDNACDSLFRNNVQVQCPTTPNVQYELRIQQEVPAITPPFQNSIVQFTIWDHGSLEGCLEVTSTVV